MTGTHHRWGWAGAALALAVVAAACGSDTESGTITVKGTDYTFEDLPKSVEAGSKLVFTNESTKEVHELVAIRLPDGEERSADELIKLPQAELEGLAQGPPAMVLLAPPGGAPQIAAVGDGTLTEKGRYLIVCSIPTGADPTAFLAAAQAPSSGPPPTVPGGAPHFVQGMYGEITVK